MQALKQFAKNLKNEVYAVFLASKDRRTPWYAKVLAGLVVAYAFSPIDLIPDPIPILGYLDDLILIPICIWLVLKLIPPDVMQDCRQQSVVLRATGKPQNWSAAIVIVLIWFLSGILATTWLIKLFRQ